METSGKNWIVPVQILGTLIVVGLFGAYQRPTEMGIFAATSAVFLGFLNLDRLEHFKGAGFEAGTRKLVDEAYATLATLQAVVKTTAATNIEIVTWSNRYGGMKYEDQVAKVYQLLELCDGLKVREGMVDEASSVFFRMLRWDYVRKIVKIADSGAGLDAPELQKLEELTQSFRKPPPSPTEVRNILKTLKANDPARLERAILDYEYVTKHNRPPISDASSSDDDS